MADGNYKQETATFVICNQSYIQLLQNCPFPHCMVHIIYKQWYILPTIGYPLLAMVIPSEKLLKHQSPPTTIFFAKLGYSKSFPHAVAYVTSEHGGIGLCHLLGHEQGLQKYYNS